MRFTTKREYRPVPLDEEKSLETSINDETDDPRTICHCHRPQILGPCLRTLLFLSGTVALLGVLWLLRKTFKTTNTQSCLTQMEAYSPAFEAVELYSTNFANEFNSRNIYRGPPTPEREEAWDKLWNQAEVLIPSSGMAKLNKSNPDSSSYFKAPPEYGDGYVAGLEVFHQLHCLNHIRQFTWYLMGKYSEDLMPHDMKGTLKVLRMHTDHCIETLRIALMCHGDVTPVLVQMDTDYDPPRPQAEFSAYHRCRNFEALVEWNERNGLGVWSQPVGHEHAEVVDG